MKTEAEFWARVDSSGECWIWTGSRTMGGYGQVYWRGDSVRAHRLAWFLVYRAWPDGLLHHRCRRPECVRPDHMTDVSDSEHQEIHLAISRSTMPESPVCSIGHPHEPRWLRGHWACAYCVREERAARKLGHLWDPPEPLSSRNSGRTMPTEARGGAHA
jgi:hypothetical protein